jgi:hypothetical protein
LPQSAGTVGLGARLRGELDQHAVKAARFVLLSAYEADLPRLEQVPGLEGISQLPADWVERLQAADIGASICENLETIRAYNSRPSDGTPGTEQGSYAFSVFADHPSGHTVTKLDPFAIRPRRGKIYALAAAEKYGASTRAVLLELGHTEAEVQRLLDTGVASESWSREYLPS